MKRVYVISRLRASEGRTVEQNIELAERLSRAAVLSGVAPLAPHAFYTRFLSDNDPGERALGMNAGAAWLPVASEAWVFTRHGVSSGMRGEMDEAERLGIPVVLDPPCWDEVDRRLSVCAPGAPLPLKPRASEVAGSSPLADEPSEAGLKAGER